jgi:AcrR family transcriptional regulator
MNTQTEQKNQLRQRRTQAERRSETQLKVLKSARKLFGERGYSNTSLEDIAQDCDMTIRPIYHYFNSKIGLFSAVTEQYETELLDMMKAGESPGNAERNFLNWEKFVDICQNKAFRQIVLVDSPNILGRDRWVDSEVTTAAIRRMLFVFKKGDASSIEENLLMGRMVLAAMTEAAVYIGEHDDVHVASVTANQLIQKMIQVIETQTDRNDQ